MITNSNKFLSKILDDFNVLQFDNKIFQNFNDLKLNHKIQPFLIKLLYNISDECNNQLYTSHI